eukprot:TRINITY_DN8707_c0_g1_i5.p1 TRINITY_DN8707_c0_g1~~TRINITY_DN8707_c0_g1_i5.p1  ORF type:complete len:1141 (-),score=255.98 TRINITY_DN8707_c0_g1_i5:316-3738(-)
MSVWRCVVVFLSLPLAAGQCGNATAPLTNASALVSALNQECSDIVLEGGTTFNITSTLNITNDVHIRSDTAGSRAILSGASMPPSPSPEEDVGTSRLMKLSGYNLTAQLSDLSFTQARAGAIWLDFVATKNVIMERLRFSWNGNARARGPAVYATFANVSDESGNFSIADCEFENNQARHGGAVSLYMEDDDVSIAGSVFRNNSASLEGGGLWTWTRSSPTAKRRSTLTLTDCLFASNTAISLEDNLSIGALGGGIYAKLAYAIFTLNNVTLDGNRASKVGAGLYTASSPYTAVSISDSAFRSNTIATIPGMKPQFAFDGGGWFSQGSAFCQEHCNQEHAIITNTSFENNSASEGAAVYVLSAAPHRFENCEWHHNSGIPADFYDGFPDGVTSRGAGLYSGLLSLNVTLDSCVLVNNSAEESGAVSLRPSIFKGELTIFNTTILDERSLELGRDTFTLKYVPQVNISFVNSAIKGNIDTSSGTVFTLDNTTVNGSVTVSDGALMLLRRTRPSNITLTVTTSGGAISLCLLGGQGVFNTTGINDDSTGDLTKLSDSSGARVPDSAWWFESSHLAGVVADPSLSSLTILYTTKPPRSTSSSLRHVTITRPSDVPSCTNETTSLVCEEEQSKEFPVWGIVVMSVALGLMLLALIGRGVILYRRWAVPGVGLVGWPGPCVLYRFLACSPHHRSDVFSQECRRTQQIDELELSILRGAGQRPEDADSEAHLQAIEEARIGEEDAVERVVSFGYGIIDFGEDLCLKEEIGAGNFGTVQRGVLRSRGQQPARMVAVKELLGESSPEQIHLMTNEAKLMQDTPHHPNVVFLFGVTESPFCLVSQLIADAGEMQDYVASLQSRLPPESLVEISLRLLLDAASGLEHLHEHRILHCDIAPRNILVAHAHSPDHRPRALINDFGLARKLEEKSEHVEFSGEYERYLGSPENYSMVPVHGMPGDVFMMASTVWETIGLHWARFRLFFEEGRGLDGDDIRQVTKDPHARLQTEAKRGLLVLYEAIHNCHMLQEKAELAELLCLTVCKGLQHDPEARPTMKQLRARLWECWKRSVVLLPEHTADPLHFNRESRRGSEYSIKRAIFKQGMGCECESEAQGMGVTTNPLPRMGELTGLDSTVGAERKPNHCNVTAI